MTEKSPLHVDFFPLKECICIDSSKQIEKRWSTFRSLRNEFGNGSFPG